MSSINICFYIACSLLLILISSVWTYYYLHSTWDTDEKVFTTNQQELFLKNDVADQLDNAEVVTKFKNILLWNSRYQNKEYFPLGDKGFHNFGCPVKTCNVTTAQKMLPEVDAVVIHAFSFTIHENFPKRARQKQIFVFLINESPLSANTLEKYFYTGKDIFNLTFTYLDDPDTDIVVPFGVTHKRDQRNDDIPSPESILNRTGFAVWPVSNCEPRSLRMVYAQELAKYIPLDIFGKCGNHTCPLSKWGCSDTFDQEYLFYLAFENSYCKDYATEKISSTLQRHKLVPIVYGGANYSKFYPPNSFIDVRDFNSPKALAEYLIHLKETPEDYLKYLE